MPTKLVGRGAQLESRRVRETQENLSPTWLAVSIFMLIALVSELSLASAFDLSQILLVVDSLLVPCSLPGFML